MFRVDFPRPHGPTLADLARAALARRREMTEAETAESAARRQRAMRAHMAGWLGRALGHEVTISDDAYADGEVRVTAVETWHDLARWEMVLIGICPECGEETISREVADLADLALLLEEFEPHYDRHLRSGCEARKAACRAHVDGRDVLAALGEVLADQINAARATAPEQGRATP